MKKLFTLITLLMLGTSMLVAQADGQAAIDYLQTKYADLGLAADDVADLRITDNYVSGGIQHIYVEQRFNGLALSNAQAALHFRGTRLVASTVDFVPNLADLQLPLAPAFSAQGAVSAAANAVTATLGAPRALGQEGEDLLFQLDNVSPKPIQARLLYLPEQEGVRLAWRVYLDQHATHSDYWVIMVDATDGSILDKDNLVLKCNFGSRPHVHNVGNACADVAEEPALPVSESLFSATLADGAKYNVFPFGEESPIHGDRIIEVDPADPVASPFGWHDSNGQDGAEFTYTRGNNVYAYLDRDGDANEPDDLLAEGGDSLVFDFFYQTGGTADTNARAAMSQLFYTSNKIHDWLHYAGFDEASGNFQGRNYSGQGEDNDFVRAEAQDGGGTNNANFFTPPDGTSGVMQMFLWTADAPKLTVNNGGTGVAGVYDTGEGQFGPPVPSDSMLTGQIALALDGTANPNQVCETAINVEELTGKIALITRGECFFENKVFNAQQGGAIAAIICNDAAVGDADGRGGQINMADGGDDLDVQIPSVFLSKEACAALFKAVSEGDSISGTLFDPAPAPIDGDFDNGIVAHEYGHGISNRLVGGPNNTGCLGNDEQMGEGWSDFYAVASTPTTNVPDPDGSESRGIGNFALGNPIDGRGIRSQPYSTDMSINNKTYDNVIDAGAGAAPHPLGETWAAALLDLYWALVARDGLDTDLITGTGGNNLAVRLVTEGLKFTRCQPGLLDGRDGILQADEILFDGANQCLIYEVFARRGMGFSADQGNRNDRTDNIQAFDLSPYCVGGVQLVKSSDVSSINAGEGVTISLEATSYNPEPTTNIVITDLIPDGMALEAGSVRGIDEADWSQNGNTLTFNIGDMEFEDDETIRYSVTTDPDLKSTQSYFEDAEGDDEDWDILNPTGFITWEQNDTLPFAGDLAWFAPSAPSEQDQILQIIDEIPLTGDQPALRYFTQYETEPRWDAGIVEVSADGGNTWDKIDERFLRGRYRGEVADNATLALRDIDSYWGNSNGYVENIIDLSDYAGENILFRFHWYSDANTRRRGWWIDNIEILDAFNYESTAVLTSDQGDNWETSIGEFGVLVEAGLIDNTVDPVLGETKVSVFPNPAGDFANVRITTERAGNASVQLLSVDGRLLFNQELDLLPGRTQTTINTADLPAGIYVVQVAGANRVSTTKLTVK